METKRLISDLLIQIRLLTVQQKEPYLLFHRMLGFYPVKLELYQQALRHKSLSVRTKDGLLINNERLEYLGDAVLNVIVADILFKQFPAANEEFLTKTRSKIVQRQSLNKIAMDLGLNTLILSSTTSVPDSHLSIYGNALEALIGAIYLDQGYRRCKRFLEKKILERHIDLEGLANKEENFKSALLEWSQQEKLAVEFLMTELSKSSTKGPRFRAVALINNINFGQGEGLSKKEAQQKAAKEALAYIIDPTVNLAELLKENLEPPKDEQV
ncbi:MAG TPA: ribonuclease III [Bacteroidales bacterium]|nr:ribonuclease III [Bacteroidales bacterium]